MCLVRIDVQNETDYKEGFLFFEWRNFSFFVKAQHFPEQGSYEGDHIVGCIVTPVKGGL